MQAGVRLRQRAVAKTKGRYYALHISSYFGYIVAFRISVFLHNRWLYTCTTGNRHYCSLV